MTTAASSSGQQAVKEIPPRDDAPSPTDSVKDDGQHFRLLIVANRLPITIKKQNDVTSRFPNRR